MLRGPLWFILSYLGRTVGYFLPLSLVWCLLVLWKLVLGEEAAKSDPAQVLWALRLKHDGFSNRDLTSTSRRSPRAAAAACDVFRVSWTPDPQVKRGSFMTGLGVFVCLWLLG